MRDLDKQSRTQDIGLVESEITTLKKKNVQVAAKLEEEKVKALRLEKLKGQLEEQIQRLEMELDEAGKRESSLQNELSKLQVVFETEKNKRQEAEAEAAKKKKSGTAAKEKLDAAAKKADKLEKERTKLTKSIQGLQIQLAEQKANVQQARNEASHLATRYEERDKEITRLNDQSRDQSQLVNRLRSELLQKMNDHGAILAQEQNERVKAAREAAQCKQQLSEVMKKLEDTQHHLRDETQSQADELEVNCAHVLLRLLSQECSTVSLIAVVMDRLQGLKANVFEIFLDNATRSSEKMGRHSPIMLKQQQMRI